PRIELTIPSAGADRQVEWGEQPDDLEITLGATAAEWQALGDDDEEPEHGDEAAIRIVASGVEVLRTKAFADLTDEERARMGHLIRKLAVSVPLKRTRRTRPSSKGSVFDLRQTL